MAYENGEEPRRVEAESASPGRHRPMGPRGWSTRVAPRALEAWPPVKALRRIGTAINEVNER